MAGHYDRLTLYPGQLGIPEVAMLGCYNYARARDRLIPHTHPGCLEICYLAKGTQLYSVGNREYVLTGGDIFVTFPGERHSTGESPEEKGHLYWVIIKIPSKAGPFLNCSRKDASILAQQLLSMPRRHFAGEPELKTILDNIIATHKGGRNPLKHVMIQNKFVEFLLRVIACSHRQFNPGISPAISALLRQIESNPQETFPVGELASRAGLSVPRFKTRFKSEVGIPPAEYVMRCKIDAAKKLLSQPGANVTAISYELNFSSSQYFATVVRRYLGCTPRDLVRKASQAKAGEKRIPAASRS